MAELILTLLMLVLLQLVLGFDNLLYISLESKRAPAESQAKVRRLGIGIAIALRIILLMVVVYLLEFFNDWKWSFDIGIASGYLKFSSIVELIGGGFIIYTAVKEIFHMLTHVEGGHADKKPKSAGKVIFWIVLMNLVFSFDSILSAIALVKPDTSAVHATHSPEAGADAAAAIDAHAHVASDSVVPYSPEFWVMAIAIVIGGVLMIVLADKVSVFLEKNRMYEVLGLFVLFLVGVMLVSTGGSHMQFFGHDITPMSKATFYFVLVTLLIVDVVQSRYQRNLIRLQNEAKAAAHH